MHFYDVCFFLCLLCLLTTDVEIVVVVTGMLITELGIFSQWDSLAVLLELYNIISIICTLTRLIWLAFNNTEQNFLHIFYPFACYFLAIKQHLPVQQNPFLLSRRFCSKHLHFCYFIYLVLLSPLLYFLIIDS